MLSEGIEIVNKEDGQTGIILLKFIFFRLVGLFLGFKGSESFRLFRREFGRALLKYLIFIGNAQIRGRMHSSCG